MPFEFNLRLNANEIDILDWIENSCPDINSEQGNAVLNKQSFIRNIRKLMALGYVTNQHPAKPAYLLTEKGELLCWLLRLEREEQGLISCSNSSNGGGNHEVQEV